MFACNYKKLRLSFNKFYNMNDKTKPEYWQLCLLELKDGRHSGNYKPVYGDPVQYRGNISTPSGYANPQFFGVDTEYTHVLVMDNPKANIRETGLIDWNGETYEIRAVRPSINVLSAALRKRTTNNATGGA